MTEIIIKGDLVGKGRPRFSTVNGFPKAYTPKKTQQYEELIRRIYNGNPKYDGAVAIQICIFHSIPKSVSKKERARLLKEEFPIKKPDIDNICKIVLDALNGMAYDDDRQVVHLSATKDYTEQTESYVCVRIGSINYERTDE